MGFDSRSEFLFTDGSFGKNVIIFGVDMSPSVDYDNKNHDILIPGKGPAQKLDDTTLKVEAIYSINFTQQNKKIVLGLHYNGNKGFFFVNATKIYQFKEKDSEKKQD